MFVANPNIMCTTKTTFTLPANEQQMKELVEKAMSGDRGAAVQIQKYTEEKKSLENFGTLLNTSITTPVISQMLNVKLAFSLDRSGQFRTLQSIWSAKPQEIAQIPDVSKKDIAHLCDLFKKFGKTGNHLKVWEEFCKK